MNTSQRSWIRGMKLRRAHIDLGLDVTRRLMRPGDTLSQEQLADICGCSQMLISKLERRALTKLRQAVQHAGLGLEQLKEL